MHLKPFNFHKNWKCVYNTVHLMHESGCVFLSVLFEPCHGHARHIHSHYLKKTGLPYQQNTLFFMEVVRSTAHDTV